MKTYPEFTSYLTRGDYIKAFVWLPVHMAVLPIVSGWLMPGVYESERY